MANLTLEEREKLKSDWQALKTKNEDAQLDQEDNFVKDKVTPPEESDIFYTPNPEYESKDEYQLAAMYTYWKTKVFKKKDWNIRQSGVLKDKIHLQYDLISDDLRDPNFNQVR